MLGGAGGGGSFPVPTLQHLLTQGRGAPWVLGTQQ